YRYGQNLVMGNGLVFNPGERILGSTAPGHMLLSAIGYAIVGEDALPSLMSILGCVAWTAQAIAAYVLFLPALGKLRAVVLSFALALGAARSFMWVPFETNIVAAFALWAFVAVAHRRFVSAAVLAGLAALMRPDALLLTAVLGAFTLKELRLRAWKPALAFLLVFLPWVIFAWRYYGSPLPQSAVTKFHRTGVAEYGAHILRLVGETAWPFSRGVLWLSAAWLAIVAGTVALARRDRMLALYAAYLVLHAVAYMYLRPFIGHDWHLYPLQLGATCFLLAGLARATKVASQPAARRGAAVLLSLIGLCVVARTSVMAATYRDAYWTGARHAVYRRLAVLIAGAAKPGDAFASVEVGTLAYYTHLRVYDMGGLVTDTAKVSGDPAVRWLVLDSNYMWMAPPWKPVFGGKQERFKAYVFHIPAGKTLTFPRVETLPP
ncbi:MAG TPA: hypothetical protein VHM19_14100, partial [Polyangiales bacterium]|nr:hypothetical protein [Polyangiales bacterium]